MSETEVSDMETMDLALARKVVDVASGLGADESECFVQRSVGTGVVIEGGEVKRISRGTTAGFGLRVIKGGRTGFAYSTSTRDIGKIARRALALSKIDDKEGKEFPQGGEYGEVEGIFDPRIPRTDVSAFIEMMEEMMGGVRERAESARITEGGGGFGHGYAGIVNSSDVEFEERTSEMAAYISCILKGGEDGKNGKGGGVATGSAFEESALSDIDPRKIGEEAAERALRSSGAERGPSGKMEAVLVNEAAWNLLENAVIPAFFGRDLKEGRSYLDAKEDERIASPGFFLYDDPLMSGGLGSSGSDDEGSASTEVELIEDGIFRGCLYDSYSAQKYGETPTSSGIRAGGGEGGSSFRAIPTTFGRNIRMDLGAKKDLDAMIGEMDEGVLIYNLLGAHTANRISGDFSVNSSKLFHVRDGEIARPIRSAMISGNALEVLSEINCVGDDPKRMSGGMGAVAGYIPSVRVGELTVTAG